MWFPGETINFGIGQGYLLVTPLQLAHVTSGARDRGKSFKPRLVTGLRDPATGKVRRIAPVSATTVKHRPRRSSGRSIIEGMVGNDARRGTAPPSPASGA